MSRLTDAVRRVRTNGLSDRQLGTLLILPSAILLIVFAVYPFLQAAIDSFFEVDFIDRSREWVGLENFIAVVSEPTIRESFVRSVVWTVGNMVVQTSLGIVIALLLNAKLKGQTIARGLVLVPYMVPAIVVALVFRYMFNDVTGVVNFLLLETGLTSTPINLLGSPDTVMITLILVNCWKYTPFIVIVLLARLQTIPHSMYEAAALDGAGRWRTFTNVVMPMLAPVLFIAMLLRTIWTAYDFDLPYLLAFGGPLNSSTTVPIEIRKLAFDQQDIGLASALSVCVAILLVAGAIFYLRAYRRSEQNSVGE